MRGYSKLSHFMCEKNHIILKQFRSTALRDILYLQAQLVHLETEFHKAAKADRDSGDKTRLLYDVEWFTLSCPDNGSHNRQWGLALQIRSVLEQYYSSVLRYMEITSLAEPKESERVNLNTWIRSPDVGGGCEFAGRDLASIDTALYESIHKKDLMILSASRGENDALTGFITGPGLDLFHRFWKKYKEPYFVDAEKPSSSNDSSSNDDASRLWYYSSVRVQRIMIALITVISSLAPLSSIIILSVVRNMAARLGIVCAFTLSFSLILALATGARRIEIFAATAAFASVQVVFVGSTSSSI